jgi:uncharacterized LabA/DUF88 family protein
MQSSPRSYAVLIDAGYLKKQLGTRECPVSFEQVDAFLERLETCSALSTNVLYRIYIYDAKPLRGKKKKPLQGGEVDFGTSDVAKRNDDLHAKLCARPFVALRLGDIVFRGWRLRPWMLPPNATETRIRAGDIEPNVSQKGVDMRIGLDIAALALKRIVDTVVLVTGDTDFIPAMKFARREGLQLFLVTLGKPAHGALLEHSDVVIDFPRIAPPTDAAKEALGAIAAAAEDPSSRV